MTIGSQVLSGARDRLLPASVPFGFFAAACVFHPLAWLHLLVGAGQLPGYAGGPGFVLAAIHVATLGVMAMTAMGAACQLLPVATRQPLRRVWPARLSFWLMLPGIGLLVHGMEGGAGTPMAAGGGLVAAALAIFALLIADNLWRARGLPVVVAHGWAALAALAGLVVLGLVLIGDFTAGYLDDRPRLALAHMVLAAFGFMGLLAFGFSHVLVPMFALSRSLPARLAWAEFAMSAGAVALAATGLAAGLNAAVALGLGLGGLAVAAYFRLMQQAMRSRMRRRLGVSFVLVRASWGFLALALLTGAAEWFGAGLPGGPALFGFLVLGGWLLSFLTAILQRILPFLATMHVSRAGGSPPRISEIAAETPLKLHAALHLAAVPAVAAGILADLPQLVQLGALSGLVAALAFAVFAGRVLLVLRRGRV